MTVYSNRDGYWEEYKCGCVSETVKRKQNLPGRCATHKQRPSNIKPKPSGIPDNESERSHG